MYPRRNLAWGFRRYSSCCIKFGHKKGRIFGDLRVISWHIEVVIRDCMQNQRNIAMNSTTLRSYKDKMKASAETECF